VRVGRRRAVYLGAVLLIRLEVYLRRDGRLPSGITLASYLAATAAIFTSSLPRLGPLGAMAASLGLPAGAYLIARFLGLAPSG
jgi:hypothetical protein